MLGDAGGKMLMRSTSSIGVTASVSPGSIMGALTVGSGGPISDFVSGSIARPVTSPWVAESSFSASSASLDGGTDASSPTTASSSLTPAAATASSSLDTRCVIAGSSAASASVADVVAASEDEGVGTLRRGGPARRPPSDGIGIVVGGTAGSGTASGSSTAAVASIGAVSAAPLSDASLVSLRRGFGGRPGKPGASSCRPCSAAMRSLSDPPGFPTDAAAS